VTNTSSVWRLQSRLDTGEGRMCAASLEGRKVCFAVSAGNIILTRNVSSFCEQTRKISLTVNRSCGTSSGCTQARDVLFSCRPLSPNSPFPMVGGANQNTGILPGVTH
jgi:hypothetical protein